MLSTVEQAKKQWCPFARVLAVKEQTSYNRYRKTDDKYHHSVGALCLANECSAWRWKTARSTQDIDLVTGDTEPRLGYCGLSGPARFAD